MGANIGIQPVSQVGISQNSAISLKRVCVCMVYSNLRGDVISGGKKKMAVAESSGGATTQSTTQWSHQPVDPR
jgi:hypothetical protein